MIVDNTGAPLWEQPLAHLVTTDFRVQSYKGSPALTWWQGIVTLGHGVGTYVVADSSYAPDRPPRRRQRAARRPARVSAHRSRHRTADDVRASQPRIFARSAGPSTARSRTRSSRRSTSQPARCCSSGTASTTSRSSESYWPLSADWDYVHLNSIGVDADENLLVSSRNTHTIYKIDRESGGDHVAARRQAQRLRVRHPPPRSPGSTMRAASRTGRSRSSTTAERLARGVLNVDEKARRVKLEARLHASEPNLHALSQGNVQVLPNGNVLVGWGAQPYVSEFSAAGELLFDARLAADYVSYRAYRTPWVGEGAGVPAMPCFAARAAPSSPTPAGTATRASRAGSSTPERPRRTCSRSAPSPAPASRPRCGFPQASRTSAWAPSTPAAGRSESRGCSSSKRRARRSRTSSAHSSTASASR